ncbi:uncharacterized protein LOC125496628 [Beta vulgaris subsp. vulgaris]|uniref:uncharacterized protein LOC125496628 n=1 Tax=Beta vulgaris subsp. vulgaris TaxID=3555 RepID=UPI002547988F|nr:uncharacterized protein LOC125496628 [Beta vulgaris subsp. vulgaris]
MILGGIGARGSTTGRGRGGGYAARGATIGRGRGRGRNQVPVGVGLLIMDDGAQIINPTRSRGGGRGRTGGRARGEGRGRSGVRGRGRGAVGGGGTECTQLSQGSQVVDPTQ